MKLDLGRGLSPRPCTHEFDLSLLNSVGIFLYNDYFSRLWIGLRYGQAPRMIRGVLGGRI